MIRGGRPRLPAGGSPYRVALVCLGNICRSPMADVVVNRLLDELREQGEELDVVVTSAGTGDWHVGKPMDERAAAVLRRHDYDPTRHRARQFGPDWLQHDLILAMDRSNLTDVRAQVPADRQDRVLLFRSFDPEVTGPGAGSAQPPEAAGDVEARSVTRQESVGVPDVPDPYYGGADGFDDVLAMVERTSRQLVQALRER